MDVASAERSLCRIAARVECACPGWMLHALDPHEERVEIDGIAWRRLNPGAGETGLSLRGPVRVQRGLYRREDVRNGPTIVPLETRAGGVEGRYTPAAARAVAKLAEALPSRDADALARSLDVLPYARASPPRAGLDIGARRDTPYAAEEPTTSPPVARTRSR